MSKSEPVYEKWGEEGTPLVFLHYFGGNARSWQWVTTQLANNFQCISFNLPGFGNTTPLKERSILTFSEWIIDQIRELSITDCVLIGHSMSGKLALNVASLAPELCKQIILVAPSPPSVEHMTKSEKQRMLKHPDQQEAITSVKQATVKKLSKEKFTLATDSQLEINHATWKWWLREGMNHSIAKSITNINLPISLIASEDDPVIPYKQLVKEITDLLPQTKTVSAQGLGHLLPLESSEWLAHKISDAVTQIA